MVDLSTPAYRLVTTSLIPKISRRAIAIGIAVTQYVIIVGLLIYAIYRGAAAMPYEWQWERVPPFLIDISDQGIRLGTLSEGLIKTVQISLLAASFTLILAVTVALMQLSSLWSARVISRGYIELIRNTPLIVQISMFYFVLAPIVGINRFWTGVACLAIFEAAFVAEIIRAGIVAIPGGQWEASASLGLRRLQSYRLVILPQAVRTMLPPLTSAGVSLIKDSSIVSVIALFELTTAGRDAISNTFMSFEIWLTVAAIYLALTIPLSLYVQSLERRLRRRS